MGKIVLRSSDLKYLKKFIKNTWDGNVTFEDVSEMFNHKKLLLLEHTLIFNPKLRDGLPIDFIPSNTDEKELQNFVNTID